MKTIQVGDVVGDYTVIDIAGSGGMGTVYKIEHVITRRIEAMKLLPPGSSSDAGQVRRFEREIQLQARLHHPNIVALYNAVRDGDSIALVMEFVEGESLQRRIDAGPLPVATAVDFTIQVLRALAYAHEAGVIHRDVSPGNIVITRDLVAKLTDFGLALGATDVRLSASGVPLGSPCYMSPEQVKGSHELDARTDLYAMGAVLHEMLTGRKLFEAEGAFAVMRAHVEAEPHLPSTLNPGLPPALDDIVKRAVAKDPARRFQSADEFRLALQHFAADAGTAPEPSRPRETWQAAFPRFTLRLPGIRRWREALLLALAPAVMLAGFYAVRLFPAAAREQVRNADRSSPAVTAGVEPQAPAVVTATPSEVPAAPELPAAIEKSTANVRRRVQPPPKAMRPAKPTEQSSAIRVTGESQSIPPVSVPRRDPPQSAEAPEPAVQKTNSVEEPETETPPMAAGTSGLKTTPPEAAPADRQNAGNRFVRALQKVNPFRRLMKHDGAKAPLKQN